MCGIVGYIGTKEPQDIIINGLKKLEYRGYDSAGIAVVNHGKIELRKHVGAISNLEKLIGEERLGGQVGIGHTRWATHGAPSDLNSHPHMDMDGTIAVVHNGTVENYVELKAELKDGLFFRVLGEASGQNVEGEEHLLKLMKELVDARREYDRV